MATVSITIPDAQLPRVTAAFARAYPGLTPKQALLQVIRDTVRNIETADAQAAALAAVTVQDVTAS